MGAIGESPPFERGATRYDGQTIDSNNLGGTEEEGKEYWFPDYDRSSAPPYKHRTGRLVKCRVVRNASGIALLPKRLVRYQKTAGNYKERVDGYTTLTAEDFAGVVDEWLPTAGVPNNDLFYIVVEGPTEILLPLAGADFPADIAIGDALVALTAATSQATTAGRVKRLNLALLTATSTGTTDGTLANDVGTHVLNTIGRAMSAKTTANTNSGVLADIFRRF